MKIIDTKACEFGYEMIMVVPYVYYLYLNKIDFRLITSKNMEPFYYFLQDQLVEYKYEKRTYSIPSGVEIKNLHMKKLLLEKWTPPPYIDFYKEKNKNILNEKYFVISNKYTIEWGEDPINYLSLELLEKIFNEFSDIKIVYNRPLSKLLVEDNQSYIRFNDYILTEKFENVLNINDLYEKKESNISFNEFQINILANAMFTVSVQGGNSILSCFCNKINLIYAKKGGEFSTDPMEDGSSYLWYKNFCNSEVIAYNNEESIIKEIRRIINECYR